MQRSLVTVDPFHECPFSLKYNINVTVNVLNEVNLCIPLGNLRKTTTCG